MDLLLGIDVGTTGTKGLLIDTEGKVLGSAHREYDHGLIAPRQNWVEQEAEDWWNALIGVVRELVGGRDIAASVRGLGLSTQGGTLVPVDGENRPLRRAITWLDTRAQREAEVLASNVGQDFFVCRVGTTISSRSVLAKMRWLRDNEPEVFSGAAKFAFVGDYIIKRLTGRYACDPSNASIDLLLNLRSGEWDSDLLGLASINQDLLPPILESGTPVGNLSRGAAEELGLPESVVVAASAHDQYCAALGAGVLREGDCLLSCGTAWVLLAPLDHLILEERRPKFLPGRHLIPGPWGLMAAMSNGGVVWDWFNDLVSSWECGEGSYEELNENLWTISPGAGGLICLPHFTGSAAPTWEGTARGAIIGLTLSHSRYDVLRAVMEGIALETRWSLEEMRGLGLSISSLKMIGGAARSPVWPRIVADSTGCPVSVPENPEAACLGAAILAGVGCGVFSSAEEGYSRAKGPEEQIQPNMGDFAIYSQLFEVYRGAFRSLRDTFEKLAEIGMGM
ncbi:MAG: xylulokinase [bacterium]